MGVNMNREQIINLSKKNISAENLSDTKTFLEKKYEISYGKYTVEELKKAIKDESPFFIEKNFIIGYEPNGTFLSDKENKIKIERMVKAIIVEGEKDIEETVVKPEINADFFAIVGKNEWPDIMDFQNIIGPLHVGESFLPPHSLVFNFLNQTEKQQKEKIVSYLVGVNVNILQKDNYIDNSFHEIGHVFWRDCLIFDEKQKFKSLFERLKPSALYEFEWERKTEEEVFCTIYKWYLKSLLLNRSFYNILEYEEPQGLSLLEDVFDRIAKDKIISDVWELKKQDLFEYLSPKIDRLTGKKFVKKGLFEEVKDLELPRNVLNNVEKYENGAVFVNLNKAILPVNGNKIDWKRIK